MGNLKGQTERIYWNDHLNWSQTFRDQRLKNRAQLNDKMRKRNSERETETESKVLKGPD